MNALLKLGRFGQMRENRTAVEILNVLSLDIQQAECVIMAFQWAIQKIIQYEVYS